MTDSPYGVYVSVRNVDGALWSSNRAEWAETLTDLNTAFGQEFADALIASLKKGLVKVVAPAPVAKLPVAVPDEGVALENVASILGVEPDEDAEQGGPLEDAAPQFEACNICGTPKTDWKPPGVSKAGKKYAGFFGCPNWRNHPKR